MAPNRRRILKAGPRRPWEAPSTRASRVRRVVPFLALVTVALGLASLPPGEPGRFTGLVVGFLGFAACGALIILVPWERLPDWPRIGIVALYCLEVAIVRESTGGGRSGFATMLLLVIVWQAAYGTRVQMAASVVLSALTITVPIVAVGGDSYPATEWRKALVFTLVAGVVGTIVHELVRRTSQERWAVGEVARVGRTAGPGDASADACRLAIELAGADIAMVIEPDGTGARITASAGFHLPRVTLTEDIVPPAVVRALRAGEAQVILDTEASASTRGGISEVLGVRAWVHQPGFAPGGRAAVDLVVGWCRPLRRLPGLTSFALPRLADEVAATVDRGHLLERLETMTREDPLTGLLNRRAFDDHLTREIARAGRTGRPLSVALVDLDRFKAFNDAHGHLVGDQLLKAAAGAWSSALRTSDVLARWGGEEFVVLMPETGTEDARVVVERIAARTPMDQTLSAGVVTVTTSVDPDALVAAADAAVYRAKAAGRDRIEVGTPPEAPAASPAPSVVDLA